MWILEGKNIYFLRKTNESFLIEVRLDQGFFLIIRIFDRWELIAKRRDCEDKRAIFYVP